ncbi:MAG TPA: universal stress protein [Opitutaceae bacterium]|nr:universal stress protein [Opitutaceae bacterium]
MKNILVPLDFSPVSRAVLREARALARETGGRLVLLHVIRSPVYPDYPGMLADVAALDDYALKVSRAHLGRLERTLRADRIPVAQRIFFGPAAPRIVDEARRIKARYIVIGTRGHNALHDFVLGSTTSVVLRRSRCPVLVVPVHPRPRQRA